MNKIDLKTKQELVKQIRAIRDKMNKDMQDMTFEEVKVYLKKMRENKAQEME